MLGRLQLKPVHQTMKRSSNGQLWSLALEEATCRRCSVIVTVFTKCLWLNGALISLRYLKVNNQNKHSVYLPSLESNIRRPILQPRGGFWYLLFRLNSYQLSGSDICMLLSMLQADRTIRQTKGIRLERLRLDSKLGS